MLILEENFRCHLVNFSNAIFFKALETKEITHNAFS